MKKLIALSLFVILLFTVIVSSPYIFESIYINNKTADNLYNLCKISSGFKNEKLVREYYPVMIFDNENNIILSDTEKDDMLCIYLEASVGIDDFEEQKKILKKSYLEFSGIESAIIGSTGFIYSFYDKTNEKQRCYELFELLLDTSSNMNYEFKNGIYTKYIAFLIDNNDYELLKKVRKERIDFLKNNGIDLWDDEEQSPILGDGAIVLEQDR